MNTTVSRVKQVLQIDAAVTHYDTAIGYAVDAANDMVARGCGQTALGTFVATEYPRVRHEGQRELLLRRRASSIVAITNGSTGIALSAVRIGPVGEVVLRPNASGAVPYWSTDADGVVVTYVYGWHAGNLPAELLGATDRLAAWLFQRSPSEGVASERRGPQTVTWEDASIPASVRAILASYFDAHV